LLPGFQPGGSAWAIRFTPGSDGRPGCSHRGGSAARFNNPTGIAIDASDNIYVSDTTNNTIRKITPAGEVTTLAGLAGVSGARDGAGNQALFNGPTGLAIKEYVGIPSTPTTLYVADTGNSTIREISAQGKVTTYAGVPGVSGLRDGTGYYYFDALFNQPRALAWGRSGVLYIADTGNAAIRYISQYDGITGTLPLRDAFAPSVVVAPPTPVPASPAPAASTGTNDAAAGGGTMSAWFFAALAGAWLLMHSRHRANEPCRL